MLEGPNIAEIAALIGDRARAEMLMALMAGQALTATELAGAARVTKQTASTHLSKLLDAGLVDVAVQGRHRYFRLADREVAHLLEQLIGVAENVGATRTFGPRDPAMRKARVCYDHLAGELGVLVYDSLVRRQMLQLGPESLELTPAGEELFASLGVDVSQIASGRRPVCRSCLDWSMRRHHLGGALGAAFLTRCMELGWARRMRSSRVLVFSAVGERALRQRFSVR